MKTKSYKNIKVGITFSTFDLFHAGHVKMIEEAKRQCDYLIVGLQLDPSLDRPEKNSPSQTIIERYIQLKGSKHIDEVVPYVSEQDLDLVSQQEHTGRRVQAVIHCNCLSFSLPAQLQQK